MNAFTYVLIFSVVGGFADLDSGNSEQSNKLQQLLSEIAKSNVSSGQILLSSSNQSIYLTININFFNSTGPEPLELVKVQKIIKKLDDECVADSECSSIPYAVCSSGNCSCSPNYFPKNEKCVGLLDESCEEDSDCGVSNSSCQCGICKCRNNFYSTENGTCLQYATGLNGICDSNEECKNIPYSSCSNGRCLCLPNYEESGGKCLGSINAMCNNSTDCVTPNAICSGTCQCPSNFYFEDNNCYEFAERLYRRVHSAQACERIPNSVFSNGRCVCSPDYYFEDDHCNYQIPSDYGTPVASAKACKFLEDAVYVEGKCYKKKKLHESCSVIEKCAVSFSECSNGECKCKEEYAEQDNRCYAPEEKECNAPEDCLIIWSTCIEGTCQEQFSFTTRYLSTKPGATAIWNSEKFYLNNWYKFPYFNASTSHDVGDEGNLAWVKNYTLDRIVAYDDYTPLVIWCRAKNSTGEFVPGAVEFDENNKLCQIDHEGQKFSTEDFEVYVDLGPEN